MATATKKSNPTRVITGPVRLSYVFLNEPREDDNGNEKYSVALLIKKDAEGKATMKKLRAAEEAAKEQGISSKWGGKMPKQVASIIHDGDEDKDLEENPEYEGHWYMNVSSNRKPGMVDKDVNPILDPTEVYSGCYARVELNAAPYEYKGKKGVSFYINNLQKIADGEILGGVAAKAEDVFEAYDDEDEDDDVL